MTKKRWLFGTLAGLVLLAFVANALIRRLSFETFEQALDERLSGALGVDVEIAGGVHLELLPSIRLAVAGVTVANANEASTEKFLEVGRLRVDVEVLPLIRGVVAIQSVDISDVDLHLETDAEGHLILPRGLDAPDESDPQVESSRSFRILQADLEDIRIRYLDSKGHEYTFDLDRMHITTGNDESPIHATGNGLYRDESFEFVADTGEMGSLFESHEPFPVDLRVLVGEKATTDSFRLHVQGTIRDAATFAGVELDVDVEGEMASIVEAFVGSPLPGHSTNAEFRVTDADGSLGVEDASIDIRSGDVIRIGVRGSISDIRELDGFQLDIDFTIRDLDEAAALFGSDLPPLGPIEGKGRVWGANERLLSNGNLRVGETRFDGDLNATFATGRRPRIDANLESEHVRLVDFGLAEAVDSKESDPHDEPSLVERWWSQEEALPVEVLREVDLDLDLRTKRLSGRGGFELEQVRGDLDLEGGVLTIHDARTDYDRGSVEVDLRIDARTDDPAWSLRLEAYNVELTRTVSQFSSEVGEGSGDYVGRLDVSADLKSAGKTREGMASSLGGRIGAMLRDGELLSGYGKRFFRDYARIAVPEFLKRRGKKSGPEVRCLIAIAPIADGVAEMEKFYLIGDRITVAGTGSIDLGRDEFDLRLAPRVHDPGLVSFAATVDVTGPIESPKFTPLAGSLARSAGRAVFENALRPLTGTLRRGLGLGRNQPPTSAEGPCEAVAANRAGSRSLGEDPATDGTAAEATSP